jgi:hypothetical protein
MSRIIHKIILIHKNTKNKCRYNIKKEVFFEIPFKNLHSAQNNRVLRIKSSININKNIKNELSKCLFKQERVNNKFILSKKHNNGVIIDKNALKNNKLKIPQ